MSRPSGQGGLRHVSDILRDITEAEQPEQPKPFRPHPFNRNCACGDCMRTYLRSVEKTRGMRRERVYV